MEGVGRRGEARGRGGFFYARNNVRKISILRYFERGPMGVCGERAKGARGVCVT